MHIISFVILWAGCCRENSVKHCVDHITCSILGGMLRGNNVKHCIGHISSTILDRVLYKNTKRSLQ